MLNLKFENMCCQKSYKHKILPDIKFSYLISQTKKLYLRTKISKPCRMCVNKALECANTTFHIILTFLTPLKKTNMYIILKAKSMRGGIFWCRHFITIWCLVFGHLTAFLALPVLLFHMEHFR